MLIVMSGARVVSPPISSTPTSSTPLRRLILALVQRNRLTPDRIVSAIFTVTADLNAEFPAHAARKLGWDDMPLLCAREIDVPGSLPRVIRLMVHCYMEGDAQHVYLRDAEALRRDLQGAQ